MATKLKVLDGCAVPKPLYPILRKLKKDVPGLTFNSVYRGDDAAKILHAHGKSTQRHRIETVRPRSRIADAQARDGARQTLAMRLPQRGRFGIRCA